MGLFSKIFGGDNDDYKGDLRNDVPHGKGTKKFSNGDIYKGEWKNGFMEGKGIITFADGAKYEGEMKDNQKHGKGIYTHADGKKFIGEFKNDMKNGNGILTSANGDEYTGGFKDELFDGIVIFVENIFRETWKPTVFETENIFIGKEKKNRAIHNQSFLIKLYDLIVFRSIATETGVSFDNTLFEQFIEPEKLKIQTESLFQFVLCEQNNIYLFLKTDLDGTAFDLNMNIPVKESMALFKQDLAIVETAMGEISQIIQFIEDNNCKYGKEVA